MIGMVGLAAAKLGPANAATDTAAPTISRAPSWPKCLPYPSFTPHICALGTVLALLRLRRPARTNCNQSALTCSHSLAGATPRQAASPRMRLASEIQASYRELRDAGAMALSPLGTRSLTLGAVSSRD